MGRLVVDGYTGERDREPEGGIAKKGEEAEANGLGSGRFRNGGKMGRRVGGGGLSRGGG